MTAIATLGYTESPKFVPPGDVNRLPASELGFALRQAAKSCVRLCAPSACELQGAYVLQADAGKPIVPIVYAVKVASEADARKIHRFVWNQNLVPFVIVESPATVRVYSGFSFDRDDDEPLLTAASTASEILQKLAAFRAEAIDEGQIWRHWAHAVEPSQRVDEKLLKDLKGLDRRLQQKEGVSRLTSHGLIGKYVYLRYLRDRDILSAKKLSKWNIDPQDVFSRTATLKAFRDLNDELQTWLNGSVFSLGDEALGDLTQAQLRLVAGVFSGDSPAGQLHLDLGAEVYDFSHIPIETLSCVYEQFLHDAKEERRGRSRGKTLGAYYTPLPLADFVISELDRQNPLRAGMKVLDPACGSGAFLVQCYRRLIEKELRERRRSLKPTELRDLLSKHIFGIDRDDDACRVAELSLILTLLDYVHPPDLENTTFQLPRLRDRNILQADFFPDEQRPGFSAYSGEHFDWIIGNPPWAEVKGVPALGDEHRPAWKWITDHSATHPTGGNQIAEAFLWKVGEHLTASGVVGLVVPAMTWFKKESTAFRQQFFSQRRVSCLANFANLAYVLFAGRSEVPASVVFFGGAKPDEEHFIQSFSPFVAEQVANRPEKPQGRTPTWNIVVNHGEVRDVSNDDAVEGNALTWKLAMWGSSRDSKLLARLSRQFQTFDEFSRDNAIIAHQGVELRRKSATTREPLEHHPDLAGKKKPLFDRLRGVGRIFAFPQRAIGTIDEDECYVRKRGGLAGLSVSEPPHIVLDASRRFAVYSDEFLAIPPRQVGAAGPRSAETLLRALSLYLNSDFCVYHQFFVSPQWGVHANRADLNALNQLPLSLTAGANGEFVDWSEMCRELAGLSAQEFGGLMGSRNAEARFRALLAELNDRVYGLLGLRTTERWIVEDFVHVHLELNKGKVSREAIRVPTDEERDQYMATLQDCLDGFLTPERGVRHRIEAIADGDIALLSISLTKGHVAVPPSVLTASDAEARPLLDLRTRLRASHSQWVYFDRRLKMYDRERGVLYQSKPLQRVHWTRRQAVLDADEIIAETLVEGALHGS